MVVSSLTESLHNIFGHITIKPLQQYNLSHYTSVFLLQIIEYTLEATLNSDSAINVKLNLISISIISQATADIYTNTCTSC